MSGVVEVAAHGVPAGTPVAVYACLPVGAKVPREPGRALRGVLRYVDKRGWVPVGTFVDRAAVLSSRADRPEWPMALAAVEEGRAKGIVAPSMVTLWFHQEDRESLAAWLDRTGAFVSTPGALRNLRRTTGGGSRSGRTMTIGGPR